MNQDIENKRQIAMQKLEASKKLKAQNDLARFMNHTNKYSNDAVYPKRTLQLQNTFQPTNTSSNSPKPSATNVPVKQFFGLAIKGKSLLISEARFEIDIQYHEKVIEIFKTIPSRRYSKFLFNLKEKKGIMNIVFRCFK